MSIPTAINQFKFPTIIADTAEMPRENWLELRRSYIGGSDAAPILGLSRYQSPIGVYFDKTEGLRTPFTDRQLKKMDSGNRMENVIAEWFAEETGKHVVKQPYFYAHPVHKFMGANVDFGVYGELAGLECKNTEIDRKGEWEDGAVPDEYFMQVQHYMAVTGAVRWYLAFCVGGWDFRYVEIVRDEDIVAELIRKESEFWNNHVVPLQPPMFDGSEAAKNLLAVMYPAADEGSVIDLPAEADDLFEVRDILKTAVKESESKLREVENKLKAMIGSHEVGMTGSYIFKYATVNKKAYMVKEQSYRQMNVKARASVTGIKIS